MRCRGILRAAFCWMVFFLAAHTTPFAIEEDMLKDEDPLYEQCLQMFFDFSTALANDVYITECHNGSENITSHCFNEYSSLCGSGELPEITALCDSQLDNQSENRGTGTRRGKENLTIRPLHRKKVKCILRVLVVMMSNNDVSLCTALQLCSEGHRAPQCNEHYSLFKESLQQFCLYPGWPSPTLGSLQRRTDLVEKCRRETEKCNSTVKILSACFAIAAAIVIVVVFNIIKKGVAALRDRRGRYTLADYAPPVNTATSATRLEADCRSNTEFDDCCSYLSHEGANKWSEFSSTPRSQQYEMLQEEKQNRKMSPNTTFESSFSDGEVCSSCCNCGSTNPDSVDSEKRPSALSESELLGRRPRRSAEFPQSPAGRGVGSSLGRGYYSESGTARLSICERAHAWRNMVAHRQKAYPHSLSASLPSKISAQDSRTFKTTKNTYAAKTHTSAHNVALTRNAHCEQAATFGGGANMADLTYNKGAKPRVKRYAEEMKGLQDRKVAKPDHDGIAKTTIAIAKTETDERKWGFEQPEEDQKQSAVKPGPSGIQNTEVELKYVGCTQPDENQKDPESTEEIESIVTTV
ncbi:uncharacterized protein LOC126298446 [Schistocerca gregaria]|uniref:uncharacterized protein LOC126298446 n=1 Tax=Schistocerca gregaria TaxID=7010 RepID=UPI00211EEBA2|nr:uncharacterized protein LOC126298446 [Schistocerca gregaria]